MGTKYLIGTNAVIEFLSGAVPESGSKWLQDIVDEDLHHLSVINQIELLGFNGSPTEMQTLEEFINVSTVLPLSDVVVQKTIDLRKNHTIKLPDAIIAATSLTYQLTLVTRNTIDFQKIEGLDCVNPPKQ
jgi:hypothetical protein